MSHPDDSPPMAEPGRRPQGADLGGIARNAAGGLADATQRSTENGDADPPGAASTGDASAPGAPRVDLGGKAAPGSAPGTSGDAAATGAGSAPAASTAPASSAAASPGPAPRGAGYADEDDDYPAAPARPDPDEPRDEGVVESLGRSISEVVTGPGDAADRSPEPR